jgi:hypothetical protein
MRRSSRIPAVAGDSILAVAAAGVVSDEEDDTRARIFYGRRT